MYSPTAAEVDLEAVKSNLRAIRARVGPGVKLLPAVKADGYGHGAVPVSVACIEAGADALCVACLEEAVELREAGIKAPILVLGASLASAAEPMIEHGIATVAADIEFARAVSEAAVRLGKPGVVHAKIDTGMGRIGVAAEQAIEFASEVSRMPGIRLEGVCTHFPSSDEGDRDFTVYQIGTFRKILAGLKRMGIAVPIAHASNSGAILAYPEADLDAVRPGIMLYGLYPCSSVPKSIPLKEALTLKTRIVFAKHASAGTTVSYGRTHTLARDSKVATIPIGYGDGYSRRFSNCGLAAVRGVRVPVIGRVCMDQCMLDVTEVPGATVGDEVILYGGGIDYLNITGLAESIGTIPYELVCALTKRVPRVY